MASMMRFEAVLHSRFAGGVEAEIVDAGAPGDPQTLRTTRGERGACLRLQLYTGHVAGPAAPSWHGLPLGTIRLSTTTPSQIDDVSVLTEIFEDRDPNEAGDATVLNHGIGMHPLSPNALIVIRSIEANAASSALDLQRQRAWRPQGRRHISSGMLGNAGRSQRVCAPSSLSLPVAADLLHRIGGAIAALNRDFSLATVILDPGA